MDYFYADAKRMLVNAALSQGAGFTYTKPDGEATCQYVHSINSDNPEKGCIVGCALIDEGIADFEFFKGRNVFGSGAIVHDLGEKGHRFTEKADFFLRYAQARQDHGNPWDRAVLATIQEFEFSDNEFAMTLSDEFPTIPETKE